MFAASFIGCSSYGKSPDNKTANNQSANNRSANNQSANENPPKENPPEKKAAGDQTVNSGEDFVLKKNETATIKNTKVRLKMLGAGQAQMTEGGDRPYCDFEIETDGKTNKTTLFVGETTSVENLTVKLNSVNTKTDPKAADPWSANSCGFVVTKK